MARKSPRLEGYIVCVGPSRSAGHWCVFKTGDGDLYFAYGGHFLDRQARPRPGQRYTFTALPPNPAVGKLPRATEIAKVPPTRHSGQIIVIGFGDIIKIVLRQGNRQQDLGALNLADAVRIADELPA